VSRIEVKDSLEQCSMGKRLKIIELGKYNSAKELLIETRTTGCSDMYTIGQRPENIYTRRLSTWGWKEWGCEQGTEVHTNGSESGMSIETWKMPAEQSKKY